MTAEEFLNPGLEDSGFQLTKAEKTIFSKKLINFAQYHVKAALEAAAEKVKMNQVTYNPMSGNKYTEEVSSVMGSIYDMDLRVSVNKESILNAYPLENIK